MFPINAKHISGGGGASGNLKIQLPLIAKEFPEVGNCFHGTINLRLELMLLVLSPDHKTQPIKWGGDGKGELFDFLRIRIEAPAGNTPVPAWIYYAYGSPHRRDPYIHEVIAAQLPLKPEMYCRILIDRPFRTLPFTIIV